jgi:ketosteroid isomerase-like protein
MLNLSAFNHNHHPSRVKMVAKIIRRGISVILIFKFKRRNTMTTTSFEDELNAIKLETEKYTEYFFADNVEGLLSLYTDDAVLSAPDADFLKGKEAIRGFFLAVGKLGIKGPVFNTVDIEVYGDVAFEMAYHTLYSHGDVVVGKGKAFFVWKKISGVWKCHRDTFNMSTAPIV